MGAFLLAAAAPSAHAAPAYLELSGGLETPVNIAALAVQSSQEAGQAGTATACEPGRFEGDPAQHLFRFRDGADTNGCLSVLLDVPLPQGARQVTVHFAADRVADTNGGVVGAPTLEQEIRLRVGTQVIASVPYFDTQDPSRPLTDFTVRFEAPAQASDVQVEWWFANRGAPTSAIDPAGRLQAWTATVRDPVVRLEDVPLPAPPAQPLGGRVQQASYLAGYAAEVWVPPEQRDAAQAGRFTLAIHVPDSILVERLQAPGGKDLPADRYSSGEDGGRRTILLPGSTLQQFGPGPYVVTVQASETLEVQPNMAALTVLALLMPPTAFALAVHRLRQRIPEKYLETPTDLELRAAP